MAMIGAQAELGSHSELSVNCISLIHCSMTTFTAFIEDYTIHTFSNLGIKRESRCGHIELWTDQKPK